MRYDRGKIDDENIESRKTRVKNLLCKILLIE